MNSVDVFERVHRGEITSAQAAEILMSERERSMAPMRPRWMPRALFAVGVAILGLLLPSLIGRRV